MPTSNGSRRPRAAGTAAPARTKTLPPVTVGRFKQFGLLVERLVSEKTSVFAEAQADYREKHRDASTRRLKAAEAAQVAAAMAETLGGELATDPGAVAAKIQQSDLRAYDEPQGIEVLLAAGLATAPALMDVVSRLVALVELPADEFEKACESDTLDEVLDAAVVELDKLDMPEGRTRAAAALEHVADRTGVAPGEAVRLVTRLVGQSMGQALQMNPQLTSGLSSLLGSLDSDGPDEPSSTTPPTGTPSS